MHEVKIDLKKCNLSENLSKDRSKWKNRTHVFNPNNWDKALMKMMSLLQKINQELLSIGDYDSL